MSANDPLVGTEKRLKSPPKKGKTLEGNFIMHQLEQLRACTEKFTGASGS
jgi:hypothetical protein